jgi:hypothetical protein
MLLTRPECHSVIFTAKNRPNLRLRLFGRGFQQLLEFHIFERG